MPDPVTSYVEEIDVPPARDGDASNGADAPRATTARVGYIALREFNARTRERLAEALVDVRSGGATRVVLDMRGNRGGAFQSAVSAAELLIAPNRPVVEVLGQRGEVSTFATPPASQQARAERAAREPLLPLQVWVDEYTASAAEVRPTNTTYY